MPGLPSTERHEFLVISITTMEVEGQTDAFLKEFVVFMSEAGLLGAQAAHE